MQNRSSSFPSFGMAVYPYCPKTGSSIDLFTSVAATLRVWVTRYTAFITELHARRTYAQVPVVSGQRLSASGHAAVDEQVHAVPESDSRSAFDAARWGEPVARTTGSPCGPEPSAQRAATAIQGVRTVDEGGGRESRRVTWASQAPPATRAIGGSTLASAITSGSGAS